MITNRDSRPPETRGFVLLYAVMTASIVLAVGISIISIALKQLSIANLGRESQYAFYAANTGAECALYLDFHGVVSSSGAGAYYRRLAVFKTPFVLPTSVWPEISAQPDVDQVSCAQTPLREGDWTEGSCADPSGTMGYAADNCDSTAFTVFLEHDAGGAPVADGPCAKVTVLKVRGSDDGAGGFDPNAAGENLQTTIDSRGYNHCDSANSRRVERGLKFSY